MAAEAESTSRSSASVQALVVAQEDLRAGLARVLRNAGMNPTFAPEPYSAICELSRRPMVYRTVVVSLQGVYQEELNVVTAIKRRFPHVAVYLSHSDGRHGALAEGMRLGADGLVADDGIHSTTAPPPPAVNETPAPVAPVQAPPPSPPVPVTKLELGNGEPLLTAEELRALLEDEPLVPPGVGGEL